MSATRAAIYCRVSTDEQAERGTSLADQQARCEAYCRSESWSVASIYIDDGASGATTERPQLTRLLHDAERRTFDRVVVTDPDRLSRDLVDGLIIERDLAAQGVEVVYLIQPTMGTLERQIRGVIAEEERRKIRERTSRGLRTVAAAGHWPGGPPPYGYRIEKNSDGRSDLVVNDAEASNLIRMIDALVDRRLTTWELAAELNGDNVPTSSAGRRVSNSGSPRWTHRRVRDLLKTARAIAGEWTYETSAGRFTIPIPAIVTQQRLQQLRERLAETSTGRNATAKKHDFLLARRVTSECGNPMHCYCRPDGTGRAYRCSMSTADRGPDRCNCRRSSADAIEDAAWELIAHELTDPQRLQQLAGLATTTPHTSDPERDIDDVRSLDRKIKRLETAIGSEIAELLANGTDPAAILRCV
jgi:site-specific DNA recombinase